MEGLRVFLSAILICNLFIALATVYLALGFSRLEEVINIIISEPASEEEKPNFDIPKTAYPLKSMQVKRKPVVIDDERACEIEREAKERQKSF